jgi:hypothetical protein
LFVDSSGNVGVGVLPSYPLSVAGSIQSTTGTFIGDANSEIVLGPSWGTATLNIKAGATTGADFSTTTGFTTFVGGFSAGGDTVGYVGSTSNTDFYFKTNNIERMRLDSSGRLGLGTSAPTGRLDVAWGGYQSNGFALTLGANIGDSTARTDGVVKFGAISVPHYTNSEEQLGLIYGYSDSTRNEVVLGGGVTAQNAATSVIFYTGATNTTTTGTERMRLDSSGRLGLGTSSPSYNLDCSGNARFTTNVDITNANANSYIYFGRTGTNAQAWSIGNVDTSLNIFNQTSFFTALSIDNTGRVGIGTTEPSSLLHCSTSGTTVTASFSETSKSTLKIWHPAASECGLLADGSNQSLVFGTNSSEKARIDSSGRLLVGTSTAFDSANVGTSWLVGIEKPSGFSALSIKTNEASANGAYLNLGKSRGTAANSKTIVNDNDELGGIYFEGADGASMRVGARVAAFVDGTPGANDLPTRLVFSTCPDNSASPTEAMRLESNGHMRVSGTIYRDGSCGLRFSSGDLIPQSGTGTNSDNAVNLGNGTNRWAVVYAGTGTINTSDSNLKQDIQDLEQSELNVASAIKGLIKKFRFTDAVAAKGNDARIHVGVIAQEVEQAFATEGLDPRRYGMFCEDTLEDGSKRLGIRYDELLAFVIAAL